LRAKEADMPNTSVPETIVEALALWDANEPVTTVEMGGMGEPYERAIQSLAFEIMRRDPKIGGAIRATKEGEPYPGIVYAVADEAATGLEDEFGFSGAQVGAAKSLAFRCMRLGYGPALEEMRGIDPERLIQFTRLPAEGGV
jgi:hypothetical protein